MPTRRQFVAAALTGVASVPVLTVLYAWWIEPHWLEVTHHDLPVAFLPGELAGKTPVAGHTHGGQCKPPFLPPPLLPVQNKRYTSGVFGLSDGRTLYISRGVGHFLPVRFNVRPEVTVFRLQPAPLAASL
jgi:predicted MPP superfamily phosphohydrolase